MPFWRCFYHIIWATHQRGPLITAQNEPIIFEAIHAKSREMGCQLLAINGIQDHIHTAVIIPPSLAVADWIRNVKGLASYQVNTRWPDDEFHFHWQGGYSVLTFGARQQHFVVNYIRNQKQHHAEGTLEPYLEHLEEED
jgi:putative transposase